MLAYGNNKADSKIIRQSSLCSVRSTPKEIIRQRSVEFNNNIAVYPYTVDSRCVQFNDNVETIVYIQESNKKQNIFKRFVKWFQNKI